MNNNDDNIKNIIFDLLPKNNKRFVIFSIVILGFLLNMISIFAIFFYGGIYGDEIIFRNLDITGYGEFILDLLLIIFGLLIGITCIKCFKYPENGVNYNFNKIMAVAFIIFSIIPIIAFFSIRNAEEKQAMEYKEKVVQLYDKNNKSNKNINKKFPEIRDLGIYLEMQKSSNPEEKRKVEIVEQIENGDFYDKLYKSFWYYERRFGHLSEQGLYGGVGYLNMDEILYYCTFFEFSTDSFIIGLFLLFNSYEPRKNTKEAYDRFTE